MNDDTRTIEHLATLPVEVLRVMIETPREAARLAAKTMAARGLSVLTGNWVGFDQAKTMADAYCRESIDNEWRAR